MTVVNKRELGLALGLSHHTLDRIAAQYPGDPSRYLTEVLAAWLQKEDESTPSWRALVAALRKPTVREEGLVDVIGKAHGMLTTRCSPLEWWCSWLMWNRCVLHYSGGVVG